MKLFKLAGLVCITVLIAACQKQATTAELENNVSTTIQQTEYPENYQSVYRKVSAMAKRCFDSSLTPYSDRSIDAELYSDLGFGEVSYRTADISGNNYHWKAKIEKLSENRTKLTLYAGKAATETFIKQVNGWANGSQSCGYTEL
jgi:hypothetical protein